MKVDSTTIGLATLTALLLAAPATRADYHSHPELRPSNRCAGLEKDPSKVGSDLLKDYTTDCQPLYWDLPAATAPGQQAVSKYDPDTGFLHGMTDRPPPLYTDGTDGYEEPGPGRNPLCPAGEIPWWKPTGTFEPGTQNPIYEVACRRGVRVHYGPWQVGTDPNRFDALAQAIVRFDNSALLDADGVPPENRREWNTGTEFYNHFASHHATCWSAPTNECNNPDDPATASNMEVCGQYQSGPETCPADDPVQDCSVYGQYNQAFRNATQYPGRLYVDLPIDENGFQRAVINLEDQIWACDHHVVYQLPAGYQGNTVNRDFRNQKGGLTVSPRACTLENGEYVCKSGEIPPQPNGVMGGAVGEIIINLFSEPISAGDYKPMSVAFDAITNALTTFVPPHTLGTSGGVWYAPYDLKLGILAMHSHRRLVKGTIDVLPQNPVRPGGVVPGEEKPDECGASPDGSSAAEHVYVNNHWDDAPVCKYYKQPDGAITLKKGDALAFKCVVNNGLVPGKVPGPLQPTVMNPDGLYYKELFYGQQSPGAYRVRFGCEEIPGVPPGRYPIGPARPCKPNPETNPPGCNLDDPGCVPVDEPYDPAVVFGDPNTCPAGETGQSTFFPYTGQCVPANIVFANVGEDEMCIMIAAYWPVEDEPTAPLPKSPSDIGYCAGCAETLIPSPNVQ